MGDIYYDQILEIGYGSGIFMPALSKNCNKLYGIDIHPFNAKVNKILSDYGIVANLYQGSVSKMPINTSGSDWQSPKTEKACGLLPSACPIW